MLNTQLKEKILESLSSVLPITGIVLVLSISVAPLTPGTLVLFLFGALLLVGGMGPVHPGRGHVHDAHG